MRDLMGEMLHDSKGTMNAWVKATSKNMAEGIVPDTSKDSEETVIKKLDEAPMDKPRKLGSGGRAPNLGDEKVDVFDEEAPDDFTAPSDDPGMDAEEEDAPVVDEPKVGDTEKEYLGKLEDTHYYFVTEMGDEDTVTDMQVVDQEGAVQFSAKEKGIEITEDPADFLKIVYQELEIEDIARDVFLKYLLPKMEQEFEQEEEDLDIPLDDPNSQDPFTGDGDLEKTKGAPPLEGFTIQFKGKDFQIKEVKGGLSINENFFEFSDELMELYKKKHGMRDLALSIVHTLDEGKFHVLLEYDVGTGGGRYNVELGGSGTFEVTYIDGHKEVIRGARNRREALKLAIPLHPGRPMSVNPIDDPGSMEEGAEDLKWDVWKKDDQDEVSPEDSKKKAVVKQTADIVKKAGLEDIVGEGKVPAVRDGTGPYGSTAAGWREKAGETCPVVKKKVAKKKVAKKKVAKKKVAKKKVAKKKVAKKKVAKKKVAKKKVAKKKSGVGERYISPEQQKGLDNQLVDPESGGFLSKVKRRAKQALTKPDLVKQLQKEKPGDIRSKSDLEEDVEMDYATLPREYLEKVLRIMTSSDHKMTPDHDEIVAELEAALVVRDQMPGGLADKAGTIIADVNPEQLRMGLAVEMEHTADKKAAEEIALDHLTEDPEYYTKLKQMEGK